MKKKIPHKEEYQKKQIKSGKKKSEKKESKRASKQCKEEKENFFIFSTQFQWKGQGINFKAIIIGDIS